EDAGRLRDRVAALERVCRELKRLDRVRSLGCCLLVPAGDPGFVRAFFVAGGRVAAERTLPPGGGAVLEVEVGLAAARRAGELDLDELLLVDSRLLLLHARFACQSRPAFLEEVAEIAGFPTAWLEGTRAAGMKRTTERR